MAQTFLRFLQYYLIFCLGFVQVHAADTKLIVVSPVSFANSSSTLRCVSADRQNNSPILAVLHDSHMKVSDSTISCTFPNSLFLTAGTLTIETLDLVYATTDVSHPFSLVKSLSREYTSSLSLSRSLFKDIHMDNTGSSFVSLGVFAKQEINSCYF